MTSISLYGDYDVVDEDHVRPRYGKPKDRRPDLKQIQTGLAVSGDGGVPVLHRAFDGGAGEVNQVVGAMESLRAMAGERRFLLVGDSKLISYENLHALFAAEVTFVAPGVRALGRRRHPGRAARRRHRRGGLRRRARRGQGA